MKFFYDIFISYALQDRKTAYRICTLLEAKGYPCYLEDRDGPSSDKRIERNRSFREKVFGSADPAATTAGASSRAIRSSRMFLLLVSPAAMKTGRVRTELFLANDQAERGLAFLNVFVDEAMKEDELAADFQYVMKEAGSVRWKGRRSAHALVTAVQERLPEPSGIPGITVELSESDEGGDDLQEDRASLSDLIRYIDEQKADTVDFITAEAKFQYEQAKEKMREDRMDGIHAFERVTILLDGEWKADNIESRRMLTDSYIQLGRLREDEEGARQALAKAQRMMDEIGGPADLCNLGTAKTVLAGILRKRNASEHKDEIAGLYLGAVDSYEDMVRKEANKGNMVRLMYGYWSVLSWVQDLEEAQIEKYHKRVLDTTDSIYAYVCGNDKLSYPPLEFSFRKLEAYYRPKNTVVADRCLVRAGIMHLP